MQNSGTKLVILLVGGAILLGSVSWWYRYGAAHRASQFWGATASRLLAESEGLEGLRFDPLTGETVIGSGWASLGEATDLSKVRGQAHLRHALLSDRNYVWDQPIDLASQDWSWCFRFYEGPFEAFVLISDDLGAIGKFEPANNSVTGYSCAPLAASLDSYLGSLKLSQTADSATESPTASSAAE